MADDLRDHGADLRGINRLSLAGIAGVVDLVEAMHYNIASVPGIRAKPRRDRTTGITRLVYQSIRGVVGIVEYGLEKMLARLDPLLGERSTWPGREALLARAQWRPRRPSRVVHACMPNAWHVRLHGSARFAAARVAIPLESSQILWQR